MTNNYSCADERTFFCVVCILFAVQTWQPVSGKCFSLGIQAVLVWFGSEALVVGIFFFSPSVFFPWIPGLCSWLVRS